MAAPTRLVEIAMLTFGSASSNSVNLKTAVRDCADAVFGEGSGADCRLLLVHTTIGHNVPNLVAALTETFPRADIVGCSASGVIGREGVSERMRAVAILAVTGNEFAVASGDGLKGSNSAEVAETLAKQLKAKQSAINAIYILTAGLDLSGDRVIEGIEKVFGPDIPIFGATAADNGKAKQTFQFHGNRIMEQGIILVGFADPTLEFHSAVHHGSIPLKGVSFVVTRSKDNQIIELDGRPAWPTLLGRLGLSPDKEPSETIPITGLGMDLSVEEQAAYNNPQILLVPIKVSEDHKSFYLPASCSEGTKLTLMQRDEGYIFDGVDRMMKRLVEELGGRKPVAVLHADCMARGRHMFNRVLKDEIIAKIQHPLCGEEIVPWLGIYGYSEYCPFAGKNWFQSYTTSLFAVARRPNH